MKTVIKIGGRAQASARLPERISAAWSEHPASFCIVHGGGDEISAFQRRVGLNPSFVNGRRVTTSEDMTVVRMVLSGLVNKKLVSHLVVAGAPAVGISGEDAAMFTASRIDSLGYAGIPAAVNIELIQTLLAAGYLPVISPLASEEGGETGEALNVNGDDAAAAIAIAMGASELLFVADVEGVLDESGRPMTCLDKNGATDLAGKGVINSGMRAKLEAGFAALAAGVERVRISTMDGLSDPGTGTLLSLEQSAVR
ncbi:MAG TPA: acetylglutamate kinase [Gemmatimonadaceae bacterium]|nr:acetylglutamate kinase [Gemmatimonadaceae bacterium]